jgi:DNA polymerase III subunit gamma/tau
MSYQVLARKYRPQTFAEVVGQEHITQTLKNALASERVHHAYLFTGVRGVGKTTVARILAKALNCQHPKDFEPCGACPPCQEIAAGRSMDVQEIDGASNTGVDDVREIRDRVRFMPSSGRYKIYIIDEVHMLSTAAFNALLKTLEEPPAHVIFIFATTESHKIPATILSRCQRYDFRRIPAQLIAKVLERIAAEEEVSASEDALHLIAREATGSLRDAQSLFDQTIAFAGKEITADAIQSMLGCLDRTILFDCIAAGLAEDPARALAVLADVFRTGSDLVRFAGDILELLRHLLVIAECGAEPASLDLPAEEIARLRELAGKAQAPQLHQMFSLWYGVAEAVARSAFPKMLLEVGLIRLCRVGRVQQLSEIVAKVDALLGDGAEIKPLAPEERPSTAAAPAVPSREQPAKSPAPPAARAPSPPQASPRAEASAAPHAPTFEAATTPADVAGERRWQEFMRWVIQERPQSAAILQQGALAGIEKDMVRISFASPHFADLQSEEDRLKKTEELLATFFKRPMRLVVLSPQGGAPSGIAATSQRKKELIREALQDDIVKQAADILGAQLHDVKVEKEK